MKMPSPSGKSSIDLVDLAAEIVEIGRVEIEECPAGAERLAALADQHASRASTTRQPGLSRAASSSQPAET